MVADGLPAARCQPVCDLALWTQLISKDSGSLAAARHMLVFSHVAMAAWKACDSYADAVAALFARTHGKAGHGCP